MYSPVQPSSTEDGGTATVYVSDTSAHQITMEAEKPSFHISRNSITLGNTLMEGTFGCILNATMHKAGTPLRDVVVKTVKSINEFFYYHLSDIQLMRYICLSGNAAEMQMKLMLEEGTRFQEVIHPNIYPLIGIVDGDGDRPLLIYPAVSHGNLKRYAFNSRFT